MSGYPMLAGLRILEVAQLAPSSVGGHLADLGAEVLKVESGPLGDPVRVGGALAVGGPDGPAFMHLRWNRGKKSVRLDLRSAEGKEAFLKLAEASDAVIEGTRAGYLDWLGLGHPVLAERNPAIVLCCVSGLGSDGPYRRLGSGGPVFDAYAGLREVTTPDEPPTRGMAGATSPSIAMYALGAYGAMGLLAAVHEARNTGRGRQLEIAGIDVAATWIPDEIDAALNTGRTVPRDGWLPDGRLPDWPRLEAYRTKDGGAMLMGAHVEKFWRNFCLAVGRGDLLEIDLSSADEGAVGRAETVWRELRGIFLERTRAEWIDLFLAHDVAGGPVNTFAELVEDRHYNARATTYTVGDGRGGSLRLPASAVRLPGEEFAPELAPLLGADTAAVLRDVAGYSDEEAARLAEG
ncbi:crotonobetainyl-CoA:carnitine CoA-transferase CaiB-like acyl-CoA transferase [Actinocorallia herbida]|uniref:Crotonobetainyl-CoA:carnitine CoA-transferase CaiB-like acyl-CoA transferase n=1 Tax=Actinocorallia herbida TaxID=58109 RepID=A0A3N1CVN3_9ACTN|nr:CaiB/BaiF CoA-transferase family protein [Actinocorallia herbida]ROO85305.1 crotonobetainyl-CoA:carnitine CoA-transferase CaiB-like acyl-CoA transferase [Actinocorallia herbida]